MTENNNGEEKNEEKRKKTYRIKEKYKKEDYNGWGFEENELL